MKSVDEKKREVKWDEYFLLNFEEGLIIGIVNKPAKKMSSDTTPSIGTASSDDQPLTLRNARAYHQANEITLAMNIAKSRERFRWAAGYSTILTAGTFVTWAFTKKFPTLMLLPLSASIYYTFWEYDLGYGKKLHRMGSEAQNIQTKERYKYFGKY